MSVTLDDLEIDFEAGLKAMCDEALKEIEGMSEAEQDRHFLLRSLEHAHSMIRLNAPGLIIDMALTRAAKHIRRARRARKDAGA